MSLVINILLIILVSLFIFFLILIFSPIFFLCEYKGELRKTKILIHFIHPWVIRISYYLSTKKSEVALLGRIVLGAAKKEKKRARKKKKKEKKVKKPAVIVPKEEPMSDTPEPSDDEEEFIIRPEPEEKEDKPITPSHIPEKSPEEPDQTPLGEKPSDQQDPMQNSSGEEDQQELADEEDPQESLKEEQPSETSEENQEQSSFSVDQSPEPGKPGIMQSIKNYLDKIKKVLNFIRGQQKLAFKLFRWLKRIVKTAFKLIRFQYISLQIRAGFENPAYTGTLHSLFIGCNHILAMDDWRSYRLNFTPLFMNRDSIQIYGAFCLNTSIARLLGPIIIALVTFPYISAFFLWWKIRKLRKKTFSKSAKKS